MAGHLDHTLPQFPGDHIRDDSFYHFVEDDEMVPNAIFKMWNRNEPIVTTTYEVLETEAKQITEGWFASKNLPPRETFEDVSCAMYTACTLSLKLAKEALGPELTDEHGINPVYVRGSLCTHLYAINNVYESFCNVAEPYATAMEMTWNALRMYKAEKGTRTVVANEMNYRLFIYACSLFEGRLGHRLDERRHGLFIKEWVQQQVEEQQERDRLCLA